MTRVKVSIGILAMLLGISIFTSLWVNISCEKMLREADCIMELWDMGEQEEITGRARKLEGDWEKFRRFAAVLVNNGRLLEIDRISSRIVHLAESGDDGVAADISEMCHMLGALKKSETPLPGSIL
jgi:hypothetical protein